MTKKIEREQATEEKDKLAQTCRQEGEVPRDDGLFDDGVDIGK